MISASEGALGRSEAGETVVDLAMVSKAMQARLEAGAPEAAAALAQIVLLRHPRHLATYERLIQAAWMLKRS